MRTLGPPGCRTPAPVHFTYRRDPTITPLDKELRRELVIGQDTYTLTISPDGLKLVPKGKRKGLELAWTDLVSGDAALATALQASLER